MGRPHRGPCTSLSCRPNSQARSSGPPTRQQGPGSQSKVNLSSFVRPAIDFRCGPQPVVPAVQGGHAGSILVPGLGTPGALGRSVLERLLWSETVARAGWVSMPASLVTPAMSLGLPCPLAHTVAPVLPARWPSGTYLSISWRELRVPRARHSSHPDLECCPQPVLGAWNRTSPCCVSPGESPVTAGCLSQWHADSGAGGPQPCCPGIPGPQAPSQMSKWTLPSPARGLSHRTCPCSAL